MNRPALPAGVPVETSPHLCDWAVYTGSTVTIVGVSEPGVWATRFVRTEMADVLAWLGDAAPDMRTASEWLADVRATAVVIPAPTVLPGAALAVTYVREEGPCVWCGRWVIRHRRTDVDPHPVACGPVHARQATLPSRDAIRAMEDARIAAREEARRARCHQPWKSHWRHKGDASAVLAKMREHRPDLPRTVEVYECKGCGEWHIGDRAKTLQYRINLVRNVRKARQRREGRR